ncbi:hypothetical protein F5B20DRAFT_560343 [Whalleya microplaca]|nr:hypothetical protein F5B20DRAFT_560343 [Whalleya microplaca]
MPFTIAFMSLLKHTYCVPLHTSVQTCMICIPLYVHVVVVDYSLFGCCSVPYIVPYCTKWKKGRECYVDYYMYVCTVKLHPDII